MNDLVWRVGTDGQAFLASPPPPPPRAPRPLCGRPFKRKKGKCTKFRLLDGPSCSQHLTEEEASERKRQREEREGEMVSSGTFLGPIRRPKWKQVEVERERRLWSILSDAREAHLTVASWFLKERRPLSRSTRDPDSMHTMPECWRWPVTRSVQAHLALGETGSALAEFQQRRCGMCGHVDNAMVKDHDHTTGWVRGWLCRSCNTQEPGDDRTGFRRYRAMPPTRILGIWTRYVSVFGSEDYGMIGCAFRDRWIDRGLAMIDQNADDPTNPTASAARAVVASLQAGNAEWGITN